MTDKWIHKVISLLKKEVEGFKQPVVTEVARSTADPFRVLISCVLSLRTRDQTTHEAASRLFALADTPQKMLQLTPLKIEKAIYPVGFYHVKAKNILSICRELVEAYDSGVPDTIEELLKLKGVGRKTANLVVTLGYNKPGICVDTHVHRISNRLGYVKTKTPSQTETALRGKLPGQYWVTFNDLLVTHGQNICMPISPFCSRCCIHSYCKKVGIHRSR
jgi:endonuclease-3